MTCPDKYYKDNTAPKSCQPCKNYCLTCLSDVLCKTCVAGRYLKNQACELPTACGDPFYPNDLLNECSPCHTACAQCVGPLISQCKKCASPYFLIQSLSICVQSCPSGYYENTATATDPKCSVCDPCATCSGEPDNCLSCNGKLSSEPPALFV